MPQGSDKSSGLIIRRLGLCAYVEVFAEMRDFTAARTPDSADELWFLEHPPVFTQGQAGRAEHVLDAGDIPIVQSNRGGQVTYHGPGQLVVYVLFDLHRAGFGVRSLVTRLENALIATLDDFGIEAQSRADAPGVYVREVSDEDGELRKIASLGLRVSRGCSYHGLALNVDMDLRPFARIDPCGLVGMRMTQVAERIPALSGVNGMRRIATQLESHLRTALFANSVVETPA